VRTLLPSEPAAAKIAGHQHQVVDCQPVSNARDGPQRRRNQRIHQGPLSAIASVVKRRAPRLTADIQPPQTEADLADFNPQDPHRQQMPAFMQQQACQREPAQQQQARESVPIEN